MKKELITMILSLLYFSGFSAFAAPIVRMQTIIEKGILTNPNHLTHAPIGQQELFVTEQAGIIRMFKKNDGQDIRIFLDIKAKVESGGEKGLLGLAFHPRFKDNGYFFVNYTARGEGRKLQTIISRFKANTSSFVADPTSEQIILSFEQPYENHNGGSLTFGPDEFLYIATGDGGLAGDPHNNGQDLKSPLGKILRMNVDTEPKTPEIFAYGLRNPWKMSFDVSTGVLWAADVGQSSWEEINVIEKGKNYGWRFKEGNHCFMPPLLCPQQGLTNPIFEYSNTGDNCSITGGYVYRGNTIRSLIGKYIYGDYCSGKVWAFDPANKKNILLLNSQFAISSFGQDQAGEIYILDHQNGSITKLVRPI